MTAVAPNVERSQSSMSSSTTTRTSPGAGSSSLDTSIDPGPRIPEPKSRIAPAIEPPSRPLPRKSHRPRVQERPPWSSVLDSDGTPNSLRNGPRNGSMNGTLQPKKPKVGGIRNTFRRLFGRKSAKDRISLPAPVDYPRHVSCKRGDPRKYVLSDPNEFITSAVDLAKQRSASVPTQTVLRSSALGSHSPFPAPIPVEPPVRDIEIPPRPERSPPLAPLRQRRASASSAQDGADIDDHLPGLGLHDAQDKRFDHASIGFAMTSGGFVEQTPPLTEEKNHSPAPDPGEFNFGLSSGATQSQEHVSLEERLVTLEIKLMDFEYAISKLQADIKSVDVKSPTEDISQHYETSPQMPSNPTLLQPPAKPIMENSPTSNYDESPESTPGMQQMPFGILHPNNQPRPRPTSIATTLKPACGDRSSRYSRNSMTELTIEHYTTLITLIRREQSARIRLEDQVTELQQELQSLKAPSPSSFRNIRDARRQHQYSSPASHSDHRRYDSPDERRHHTPLEDNRRPYSRDSNERFLMKQQRHQQQTYYGDRSRSTSNYNDETDTDEEMYHEVFVTPVERGELEREDLEGEEGLAF
ncbi:MAG: hypothetical protein Q9219_000795 [cf. Caloplaca sp. 3 TL-2023]